MRVYLYLSVLNTLLSIFPSEKASWYSKRVDDWSLQAIVNYFQKTYKKILLVVLDEVDLVCQYPSNTGYGLTDTHVKRYHDLWRCVDPITRNLGTTFCCCGRSSMLFAIGCRIYHQKGISPPGVARYIILDTFSIVDIIGYITEQLGTIPGGKLRFLSFIH